MLDDSVVYPPEHFPTLRGWRATGTVHAEPGPVRYFARYVEEGTTDYHEQWKLIVQDTDGEWVFA